MGSITWLDGWVVGKEMMTEAEKKKKKRMMAQAMDVGGVTSSKIAKREGVNPKSGTSAYGNVKFADERNKKYPIDTEAHVRAAWNYINHPRNAGKYSSGDLATIKGRIKAAGKRFGINFSEGK